MARFVPFGTTYTATFLKRYSASQKFITGPIGSVVSVAKHHLPPEAELAEYQLYQHITPTDKSFADFLAVYCRKLSLGDNIKV